ncbi:MAG: SixA phosphatase family protein [Pseudorhizobium sp.]
MADHAEGKAPLRHRRLLLLRHAKSAWPDGVLDRDRPLAERGQKAAPAMAGYMVQEDLLPDLALVSDAQRTRETWSLVKSRMSGRAETRVLPELYDASADRMLEVLRRTEATAKTVLVLGHNPGLQDLALLLVGDGDAQARDAMAGKYPTSALAVVDFTVGDWSSIKPGAGFLTRFLTPRMLR